MPKTPGFGRTGKRSVWGKISRTARWKPWPRPGPNTASTRFSTPESNICDENGRTKRIESLFDSYIKRSTAEIRKAMGPEDWCVSVFKDNAGVIRFNQDWNFVFKVETHNSPSALDPYGGALTGIVGVNRDPFGTGKGRQVDFQRGHLLFRSAGLRANPCPPACFTPRGSMKGCAKGSNTGETKAGFPR